MKKMCVFGLGISGKAVARYYASHGYTVLGVDRESVDIDGVVSVKEGDECNFIGCEFAVISPGISLQHPVCLKLKESGVSLYRDLELFLKLSNHVKIGVTGTNGKTTFVSALTHLLNKSGKKAVSLGNIGTPFFEFLQDDMQDVILVCELSSYQLEGKPYPGLDFGVLLNIEPDHLERYKSFEEYANTKCRLKEYLVKHSKLITTGDVAARYHLEDVAYFPASKRSHLLLLNLLETAHIRGMSQGSYGLLLQAADALGIKPKDALAALKTFQGLEHRFEEVVKEGSVRYINDSKSTNPASLRFALEQCERPVLLIAGGVLKGCSFRGIKEVIQRKVKKLFTIGSAADNIRQDLEGACAIVPCESLDRAVKAANQEAIDEDIILLSPGCASFDQFKNYEMRGVQFKKMVKEIQ